MRKREVMMEAECEVMPIDAAERDQEPRNAGVSASWGGSPLKPEGARRNQKEVAVLTPLF